MINPSFKNIFFFICGIILGIVVLLVSYLALKNSDMDLKGLDNYTGKVTYTGLIRKKASYVFAFRIEKLNQLLGVYDIKQDYSELTNNIKIGDTITVYYQKRYDANKVNVDVYQISKNSVILLALSHKEKQEKTAFYIGLIGGLLILFQSFRLLYKK